jgi:exopolysaccharide biosynthesis polyprenyl glycosylphosphotransferase
MKIINKKEPFILWLGDILVFTFSLWLALALRFWQIPSIAYFISHLLPFSLIFLIWFIVFFIAGLYEKHTLVFKKSLFLRVFNTQIFNSFLAIVFFYFIPYFGITPKIILFLYIIICLSLLFIWRIYGQTLFTWSVKDRAIIFGQDPELAELLVEINNNPRYGIEVIRSFDTTDLADLDFQTEIIDSVRDEDISVIVIDLENENLKKNLSYFYSLLFSKVRFMDINILYEDIFDRIPLSLISYEWFLKNISLSTSIIYDVIKRSTDILVSFVLGLLSLLLYPFIFLGIKIDSQGSIFIIQERIGQNNKLVKIIKFRSMTFNDNEDHTNNNLSGQGVNKITTFGAFLRKSRLDEIPQLWNVLKGDLSLIGPRPELPALALTYEKEVPYYSVRHLIKPGLSGWAQLYHENHPHQGVNTVETKNKLSYDLYYIKNRSLLLDIKIALKTIKALLSRKGK